MITIDREKYLRILGSEGLPAALSALHRDTDKIEYETFEGRDGYQPLLFEYLETVREFSRELWRSSMEPTVRRSQTTS